MACHTHGTAGNFHGPALSSKSTAKPISHSVHCCRLQSLQAAIMIALSSVLNRSSRAASLPLQAPVQALSHRQCSRASSQHCTTSRQVAVQAAAPDQSPSNTHTDGLGVSVTDDMDDLLSVLPADVSAPLIGHPRRDELLEIIVDLGRKPYARFQGCVEELSDRLVTREDLQSASERLGDFGLDNRAGIEGTLHRISAMKNRRGDIIGLTCRVGRAVNGHVDMIRDLLEHPQSILFLGRPGVGKTTVIRELARTLADDCGRRVVIVDTSNEIGGDGDVPHPAIGSARRMQVPDVHQQHGIMIEAVENHMPEVVVVDEIGTEAEALACRTIAERGVTLVATAHGQFLENLMNNPMLSDLVGGLESVTLGDDTARSRNSQKSVLERRAPSTFPVLVEMRERDLWVQHVVEESVDALLLGDMPYVKVRRRNAHTGQPTATMAIYSENLDYGGAGDAGNGGSGGGGGGGAPPMPSGARGTTTTAASPAAGAQSATPAATVARGDGGWGAVVGAAVPSGFPRTTDAAVAQALNEQYSAMLDTEAAGEGGFRGAVVGGVQGGLRPGQDAARAQVVAAGLPGAWVEHMQDLDDVAVLSAMSRGVEGGNEGTGRSGGGKGRGSAPRAQRRRQRKSF
eukprot:jgi/Ulvmu1/6079/UM027_0057.1